MPLGKVINEFEKKKKKKEKISSQTFQQFSSMPHPTLKPQIVLYAVLAEVHAAYKHGFASWL